jgi:phosphate transport system protein
MSDHTNKQFDAEMEGIRSGVLSMGGIVEQQGARAIYALEKDDDSRRTDAVGADEAAINQLQMTIDQQCAQIIATSADCRRSADGADGRKIVNDLERIGDEVKKIAYKAGRHAAAIAWPACATRYGEGA